MTAGAPLAEFTRRDVRTGRQLVESSHLGVLVITGPDGEVVASLGDVPASLSQQVIEEFYTLRMAHQSVKEGGLDYAKALLKESLDPKMADRVIQQIQTQVQRTPFAFLQKAESENLLTFIQDEHPQTIALIISHLPHLMADSLVLAAARPSIPHWLRINRQASSRKSSHSLVLYSPHSSIYHRTIRGFTSCRRSEGSGRDEGEASVCWFPAERRSR